MLFKQSLREMSSNLILTPAQAILGGVRKYSPGRHSNFHNKRISKKEETMTRDAETLSLFPARHKEPSAGAMIASEPDLRKIGNVYQTILTGEGYRPVAALRLCHPEDPVVTRIVNRKRTMVIDDEPARFRKYRITQIVLRSEAPGLPNPLGHQSDGASVER